MTCAHSLQCKHPLLKAPDDYARLKAWHATVLVCMHPLHQPVKQWLVQGLDQRVPAYKNLGMHSCLCSAAFASGGGDWRMCQDIAREQGEANSTT